MVWSIKITCLQLAREQLFIASNVIIGECALLAYKQKWGIERSFLSLKSSGLNIEDTHITDQKKAGKTICNSIFILSYLRGCWSH